MKLSYVSQRRKQARMFIEYEAEDDHGITLNGEEDSIFGNEYIQDSFIDDATQASPAIFDKGKKPGMEIFIVFICSLNKLIFIDIYTFSSFSISLSVFFIY